jgi:hypothetical protein
MDPALPRPIAESACPRLESNPDILRAAFDLACEKLDISTTTKKDANGSLEPSS